MDTKYRLEDLHYNTQNVPQFNPKEAFEDLEATLKAVEETLMRESPHGGLAMRMLSFFQREVAPLIAYRDNDLDQGTWGPRHRFVAGTLKNNFEVDGLFARIGIFAPGENPLIPCFQLLYLQGHDHVHYLEGEAVGMKKEADSWVYDFTVRYGGMVKGVNVRTKEGINTLPLITLINSGLLNESPPQYPF